MAKALDALREAAETKRLAEAAYKRALRRAIDSKAPVQQIAEAAGVTRSAVYQILNPKERTK